MNIWIQGDVNTWTKCTRKKTIDTGKQGYINNPVDMDTMIQDRRIQKFKGWGYKDIRIQGYRDIRIQGYWD